jgi:tRNA dimethylallyltransferase
MRPLPVALVGTTASHKSRLAHAVARLDPSVEIVSVDSMSVYRGMDLGTAKPSAAARREVRYHLIDLFDPWEECTVSTFRRKAEEVMTDIIRRDKRALLVGGTGLYLRALVDRLQLPGRWPEIAADLERRAGSPGGLEALYRELSRRDAVAASRIVPSNRRRVLRALEVTLGSGHPFSSFGPGLTAYPPTDFVLVGSRFVPALVDARIEARFSAWMEAGLLDEVRALARGPRPLSRTARQALGYRELLAHVEEGRPLGECVDEAIRRTRAYARRQWAWFRRDPRIEWLASEEEVTARLVAELDAVSPAAMGSAPAW